jgi:hypothetical protein
MKPPEVFPKENLNAGLARGRMRGQARFEIQLLPDSLVEQRHKLVQRSCP